MMHSHLYTVAGIQAGGNHCSGTWGEQHQVFLETFVLHLDHHFLFPWWINWPLEYGSNTIDSFKGSVLLRGKSWRPFAKPWFTIAQRSWKRGGYQMASFFNACNSNMVNERWSIFQFGLTQRWHNELNAWTATSHQQIAILHQYHCKRG